MKGNSMKKAITLALTLVLILSLTGCKSAVTDNGDKNTTESTNSASTENEKNSTQDIDVVENSVGNVENSVESSGNSGTNSISQPSESENSTEITIFDADSQLEVMANSSDEWLIDDSFGGASMYAVCDLDDNGRLDLIASNMAGSGLFTTSNYYEINSTLDKLTKNQYDTTEGDSEPDVMVALTTAYYDFSANLFHYIFEDVLRIGAAESVCIKSSVTLEDGVVSVVPLVTCHNTADDSGNLQSRYYDNQDYEISVEDYETLDYLFEDCEKLSVTFNFVSIGDSDDIFSSLSESYNGFTVTAEN